MQRWWRCRRRPQRRRSRRRIDTSNASGNISYWLWDANQQPAYQACADAFHAANPDVKVKITQYGWDDYWSKLTTVSSPAPRRTSSPTTCPSTRSSSARSSWSRWTTRSSQGRVQREPVPEGLADLWKGQDGKRYGLPKDFDTVAHLLQQEADRRRRGHQEAELQNLTWNPTDGGTYEKTIAHLTVDANGKRGDEPGFDKTKVKIYGLGLDGGSGGGDGQTQWSMYTGSNGWHHRQESVGHPLQLRRPDFQETIGWWRR